MPTSFAEAIPVICRILQDLKPKRVLDMGVGWGKYGILAREYGGAQVVDGVEIWDPYIHPWQIGIYDTLHVKDIRALTPNELSGYDLTLMIDVLEHFDKAEGHQLLQRIPRPLVISTPVEDYRASYANPYEDHRSHWALGDFAAHCYTHHPHPLATIVVLT